MQRCGILILTIPSLALAADPMPDWQFQELRRISTPEARQGVAADAEHFYAIGNHAIGKYRRGTGRRVGGWECAEGDPLIHLNAGVVLDDRLYCAHSNFPGVPHVSSVEIWNTETLQHVGSRSFGLTDGSLTWIDRRNERWIACFVHYGRRGGAPGRGPEWTRIVEFDDEWRQTGGWAVPLNLMTRIGQRGYSLSGGGIGPRGHLYVTGHDEAELYVLAFPGAGGALKWIGTVRIPAEGQAFAWDRGDPGILHLILKRTGEVITGRVIPPEEN